MKKHIFPYIMEIGFLFFNTLILNPPLLSATPAVIDHRSIDGLGKIVNDSNVLQWYPFDHAAAGHHEGGSGTTVIYTIENGEERSWEWVPDWSEPLPAGIRYEVVSPDFTDLWPAFPDNGFRWNLTKVSGSGHGEIGHQPSVASDSKSGVELDDNPFGESSYYGITLNSVPEPATMLLVGAGLAGFGMLRRKFK